MAGGVPPRESLMGCARFRFRSTHFITILLLKPNEGYLPESLRSRPCCACMVSIVEVVVRVGGLDLRLRSMQKSRIDDVVVKEERAWTARWGFKFVQAVE